MLLLLPTVRARDQSLLCDSRCRLCAKAPQQLMGCDYNESQKYERYTCRYHDSHPRHFCRAEKAPRGVSEHQRNKLAAAGDFKLAEDAVNMLFHRR